MLQLLLELWGWFTIHLKDMNLRIEMSGETFPTALWFKSYSKNSRVLTVLWDTLYITYKFCFANVDDVLGIFKLHLFLGISGIAKVRSQ